VLERRVARHKKEQGARLQHEWFDAEDRLELSNTAFGFVLRF